jgi:hypothetical protein
MNSRGREEKERGAPIVAASGEGGWGDIDARASMGLGRGVWEWRHTDIIREGLAAPADCSGLRHPRNLHFHCNFRPVRAGQTRPCRIFL